MRMCSRVLAGLTFLALGSAGCHDNMADRSMSHSDMMMTRSEMNSHADMMMQDGQMMHDKGMQMNDQQMMMRGDKMMNEAKMMKDKSMMNR